MSTDEIVSEQATAKLMGIIETLGYIMPEERVEISLYMLSIMAKEIAKEINSMTEDTEKLLQDLFKSNT